MGAPSQASRPHALRYGDRYGYGGRIDKLYAAEIGPRLGPREHYMDHTAAGQYWNSQVRGWLHGRASVNAAAVRCTFFAVVCHGRASLAQKGQIITFSGMSGLARLCNLTSWARGRPPLLSPAHTLPSPRRPRSAQVAAAAHELQRVIFGNPHSISPSALHAETIIEEV